MMQSYIFLFLWGYFCISCNEIDVILSTSTLIQLLTVRYFLDHVPSYFNRAMTQSYIFLFLWGYFCISCNEIDVILSTSTLIQLLILPGSAQVGVV